MGSLDESPHGTWTFDASHSTSKAAVTFLPSSEIGWLPPSLGAVDSQVVILPFPVT